MKLSSFRDVINEPMPDRRHIAVHVRFFARKAYTLRQIDRRFPKRGLGPRMGGGDSEHPVLLVLSDRLSLRWKNVIRPVIDWARPGGVPARLPHLGSVARQPFRRPAGFAGILGGAAVQYRGSVQWRH